MKGRVLPLAATLLCCLAFLAGCAPFGIQNVNDLLRAPALGEGQGEVQEALAGEVGDEIEFKFPKEGDQRSPLVMADLDGDGVEEAVVLYSLPAGAALASSNVRIAVLARQADESWAVVQDEEGVASDVASLEVADLLADGTKQVLVGYATANLGTKTLAIYRYREGGLVADKPILYSRYALGDFTGRGGTDLIVVSRDDQVSGLLMQYIPAVDGAFDYSQNAVPLGTGFNLTSCLGLYASESAAGEERLIVADCLVDETNMLVSPIIHYSNERFYEAGTADQIGETGRQTRLLTSRDIDGDGIVEVPRRVGNEAVITPKGDKNLEFIEWMDFTGEAPLRKQFGLLDTDRGVYIRLPDGWLGGEDGEEALLVQVVDGSGEGEWAIENKITRRRLLSLVIYGEGEEPPEEAELASEASNAWLVPQSSLPMSDWRVIEALPMSS